MGLEEAWNELDDDGNGQVSFSEFVDWASSFGLALPVGVEGIQASGGSPCNIECSFVGCKCTNFNPMPGNERFCACGHKKGLHAASDDAHAAASSPGHWQMRRSATREHFFEWVTCTDEVVQQVQCIVDASIKRTWTRDRGKAKVPTGYCVTHVKRCENSRIWRKYALKKT